MMNKIKAFFRTLTWQGWAVVAVLLFILVFMSQCGIHKLIDNIGDNKQIAENNQDREIREDLSEKRQETEAQIVAEEKQINEELAKLPDEMPSDRRIARACIELRNDGHVELPAVCRSKAN